MDKSLSLVLFTVLALNSMAFADCPFTDTIQIQGPAGIKILSVTPFTTPWDDIISIENMQANDRVTFRFTQKQLTISQTQCDAHSSDNIPTDALAYYHERNRLFTLKIGYNNNNYCEIDLVDGCYSSNVFITKSKCTTSIAYNFSKTSTNLYSFNFRNFKTLSIAT